MTITPALVRTAITARIREVFPGETVYEELVPAEVIRPSNLVELVKIALDPQSMGRWAVGIQYQCRITTFCQKDPALDSHLPAPDLRAMAILGAFACGRLNVSDRALTVAACAADTSLHDTATVTLTLALSVDRAEFAQVELPPMMREVTAMIV